MVWKWFRNRKAEEVRDNTQSGWEFRKLLRLDRKYSQAKCGSPLEHVSFRCIS